MTLIAVGRDGKLVAWYETHTLHVDFDMPVKNKLRNDDAGFSIDAIAADIVGGEPNVIFASSNGTNVSLTLWNLARAAGAADEFKPRTDVGSSPLTAVAISADGKTIVAGTKGGGVITCKPGGTDVPVTSARSTDKAIVQVSLSADGNSIVSTDDTSVRLWVLNSDSPPEYVEQQSISRPGAAGVHPLGASWTQPGGTGNPVIVPAAWQDGLGTWTPISPVSLPVTGAVTDLAFSKDANQLAACAGGSVVVYQGLDGAPAANTPKKAGDPPATSISFLDLGSGAPWLIAGSDSDKTVRVWKTDGLTADPRLITSPAAVVGLAPFLNGRRPLVFLTLQGSPPRVLDLTEGLAANLVTWQVLDGGEAIGPAAGFIPIISSDPAWLVVSNGTAIELWPVNSPAPKQPTLTTKARVNAVGFNADGSRAVIGIADGSFQIIETDTVNATAAASAITGLSKASGDATTTFASMFIDATNVALATDQPAIGIWGINISGVPDAKVAHVAKGHSLAVRCLAVGKSVSTTLLASGSTDASVGIFDAATGTRIRLLSGAHADVVRAVAFNSNASKLASVDSSGVAVVWKIAAGTPPTIVPDSTISIRIPVAGTCLVWSDDGKHIAIGGSDHRIYIVPQP